MKTVHNSIPLNVGYIAKHEVLCLSDSIFVTCEVKKDVTCDLPLFVCFTNDINISGSQISVVVNDLLGLIHCVSKKHWSRFDFFGITHSDVKKVLVNMIPVPKKLMLHCYYKK